MALYSVHIETVGHSYITVEANSEEEAIEIAENDHSDKISEIDCGQLENIESIVVDARLDL